MAEKPKMMNSESQKQIDKAETQLESFDSQVKELTMDRINQLAPTNTNRPDEAPIGRKELANLKDIYLKPEKVIGPGVNPKTGVAEKFNEKFRAAYEFDKELVQFQAVNNEIIGETLEIWTKPYGGTNCEFWKVPCNKAVWGPRYLAEQIKRKFYHRLRTEDRPTNMTGEGTYYGSMVVDNTIQRLDAYPVSQRRSVFMGSTGF
jgi:hypothetical protein